MMFELYNPHPNGKLVGDCVKRAFTKASGKTYQEVSNDLNRIKRDIGATAYNSNKVWTKYVTENLGGVYKSYPAKKGEPRMNGERFCESHPVGTFVLRMAGHLSCCVDGVIYDTWDCSEKCVYGAYLIEHDAPSTLPKMMPMPGIERLAALADEYKLSGNKIIEEIAELLDIPKVKKTKSGELWISLSSEQYAVVLERLLHDKRFQHLRWSGRRGSKKSKIWDEKTGMEFILKNGNGAYLWCTNDGNN